MVVYILYTQGVSRGVGGNLPIGGDSPMPHRESLSGGCRAGFTLERCSQVAAFAIRSVD